MKVTPKNIRQTKCHLCANGSILLPLAQEWRLVRIVVCCFFAMLILPAIAASSASAVTSLSFEISTNPLTVNANTDGTGTTSSTATLKVSGTAAWGYTLTMSGSDKLISGSNTLPTIKQETADISAFDVNTWGYMFTGGSPSNNNFRPGSTASVQLDNHTSALSPSSSVTYNVTLGAKVNSSQPAGNYTGTFRFTATANEVHYSLSYLPNDDNTSKADNIPGDTQEGTSSESSVTLQLSNSIPTWEGYIFKGWCDQKPANSTATCNGTTYEASKSITLSLQKTASANNKQLWAVWEKEGPTMQNFKCSSLAKEGESAILRDTRDDNEYLVAKLKDGKCWMVQNLRLGKGKEPGDQIEITSKDSDISNVNGSFKLTITPETYSTRVTGHYETGQGDIFTVYDPNTNAAYINDTYGGYYSWYTATAGSGNASIPGGENAKDSICPKGWRLPTGGSKGDFESLANAYGYEQDVKVAWKALQEQPIPGFQLGGSVGNTGGGLRGNGSEGNYWPSTHMGSGKNPDVYFFSLKANQYIYTATSFGTQHFLGFSVRCVARQ